MRPNFLGTLPSHNDRLMNRYHPIKTNDLKETFRKKEAKLVFCKTEAMAILALKYQYTTSV
jgi:hypothetical protein